MPQPPKTKPKNNREELHAPCEEDQKTRDYYYDDAHGYETYVPGTEDNENTEAPEQTTACDDD